MDREGSAIGELVAAAGSLLDPEALALLTVNHVRDLTGAHGSELYWWDDHERVLTPLALVDRDKRDPDPHIHPGQGLVGTVFATGRELIVDDYQNQLEHPVSWVRTRAAAGVPLVVQGRPCGVLTAIHQEEREFGEDVLRLLRMLAAQLAPALMNMRLLAQAQRRAAEARGLAELMRRGSAAFEPDEVFRLIATYGCRLLGADFSGLVLADPDGRATSWCGVYGARSEQWRDLTYSPSSYIARVVFPSREPVVSGLDGDGEHAITPASFPFLHGEGAQRGLSVPLRMSDEPIGSLVFGWRFALDVAPAHIEFAVALASFGAVLADQARQEHRLATVVESAPIVLSAMDPNGYITFCEGRGLDMLGFTGDVVGRNVRDVFADSPEVLEAIVADGPTRVRELTYEGRTFEAHLSPRAGGGFLVATDVTERKQAQDALEHQATHDALTGLPNRGLVVELTTRALDEGPVAALLIDLRSFDDVNDTVGHDAGDELLQRLAERLVAVVPEAIVIGRTGGDEFSVVSHADGLDGAREMAAKVVGTLRDPIMAGGCEIQIAGRYGLALSAPGIDAPTLLRRADSALQEARRDNFTEAIWNEEMAAQRTTALRITQDLRRALSGDELSLVFQPLVDIATRRPVRAEALLRWMHPLRGAIEPSQFIPLAERSGLISQITTWVLDRALDQAAQWRTAGLDVPVDVNVSAVDLRSGGLAQMVADGLTDRGLPPEAVCIEITETALVGEVGETITTLEALAHMGVVVSIDDFGTGWSSLAYLKRLPAGEIKLDRSFVGSMGSDPRDAEIVRAAIGLGRALGVEIVAEGVEDEPTVSLLTQLGCTLGQGFLFARPMSADALTAQLRL